MSQTVLCSVPGCSRSPTTLEWCDAHYQRKRKFGEPGTAKIQRARPRGLSLEECLCWYGWTVTEAGCWEWNGLRDRRNYGLLYWNRRVHRVHRLAYRAWRGELDDQLLIRHHCDNPPCINPEHLEPGTGEANSRDMLERGRGCSTMTPEQIREIRRRLANGELQYKIAQDYRVDPSRISQIHRRKVWAWFE